MKDFFLKGIESHAVLVSVVSAGVLSLLGVVAFFIKRYLLKDRAEQDADIQINIGSIYNHEASIAEYDKETAAHVRNFLQGGALTSFAYFCDIPESSYAVLGFFYGIQNSEKSISAAKKIHLLLEYPSKNLVSEDRFFNFKD